MSGGGSHPGERARRALATGFADATVDADGRPLVAAHAAGAWLTDVDGRRFVDLDMAHGALLLGHAAPEIEDAIRAQLGRGTLCSLPHRLEVEVAERLVDAIPGAERVAFGKNGSDVTTAAVRIARAVTGRDGVLQFGYHGFHDWAVAVNPAAEGVPAPLRELVHTIGYGDVVGVAGIFAAHAERIAAVIVEPFREAPADAGFLRALRELTARHGAVLVFDEMVTGFRVGRGGAQARFGVTADLACFGKALAHGMPLAALCGRDELVGVAPRVAFGMTARGECLSLAAARAALDVYAARDVAARIRGIGERLRDGFDAACRAHGLVARLGGDPAMLFVDADDRTRSAFVRCAIHNGLLTHGAVLPSVAHAGALGAVVERFDRACRDATASLT